MSLFRHRHRPADVVYVERPSALSGVLIPSALAALCRCGAVLSRELTDAGDQQVSWGVDRSVLFAELDREIVRRLEARAS